MPISGPAAGILGAAAGINAMLKGQIRSEMLRQQRAMQQGEVDLEREKLDIEREQLKVQREKIQAESGMLPEDIIKQEAWLKYRTNPEKLTQDERVILGLAKPIAPDTQVTSLAEAASKLTSGQWTAEEFDTFAGAYGQLSGHSLGDQLYADLLKRVPKVRKRIDRPRRPDGSIDPVAQPIETSEDIPLLEQHRLVQEAYTTLLPRLRGLGVLPLGDEIDDMFSNRLYGAGPAMGPESREGEIARLRKETAEEDAGQP